MVGISNIYLDLLAVVVSTMREHKDCCEDINTIVRLALSW
jgi:hypothetical protein